MSSSRERTGLSPESLPDWTRHSSLDVTHVYKSAVPSSITDTALQGVAETTLKSAPIKGMFLGKNDGLRLEMLWSCTNTAAAKRIRARFGGTVLFNLDLTTHLTFRQEVILINRGSQSSQIIQANSTTIFAPIGSTGLQAATIDFAIDQMLTVTGQFPVAGTGLNSLALESLVVERI